MDTSSAQARDERYRARIVVATDGSPAALRGVAHAARVAQFRRVPLEIVHATPGYLPMGPFPTVPDDALRNYGHEALDQARTAAVDSASDVEITCTLARGGRVESLVACAADAWLLVLGSRQAPWKERVWTGSTVTGVASRSSSPVLAVPPEYDPTDRHGRLVVGLKTTRHIRPLLAAAFEAAEEQEAELAIVHVWSLAPGYDDLVSDHASRQRWRAEREAEIETLLVDLRRSHPDVKVRLHVIHGEPADVLVREAVTADLMLITRPVHGKSLHHLGATARAVLREAQCPVEVIPPTS